MHIFDRLERSYYRKSFHLKNKELEYLRRKGIAVVRTEAIQFIMSRIQPAQPVNDGKQTPLRNHPVFVAQHATATCCRKCIEKWHQFERGTELSNREVDYLVNLIMKWLDRELARNVTHPFLT